MIQQSDKWKEWRRGGIGSSDAPIIMGVSEHKTPYQLWREKVGLAEEEEGDDFILRKGHRLEKIARARYELQTGLEMRAEVCQHHQVPWLRTSMDGLNIAAPPMGSITKPHKRGLELKYCGKADHEYVKQYRVPPEKYVPQVQHQFIVTGAEAIDFGNYYQPLPVDEKGERLRDHNGKLVMPKDEDGELFVIEVVPDMDYIKKYLEVARKFWECVVTRVPPPLCERDYKLVRSVDAKKAANDYKVKLKAFEQAKWEKEVAHDALCTLLGVNRENPRFRVENTDVEVVWRVRKGNVQYAKVPELKGVNLEPYRAKESEFPEINIKEKKVVDESSTK